MWVSYGLLIRPKSSSHSRKVFYPCRSRSRSRSRLGLVSVSSRRLSRLASSHPRLLCRPLYSKRPEREGENGAKSNHCHDGTFYAIKSPPRSRKSLILPALYSLSSISRSELSLLPHRLLTQHTHRRHVPTHVSHRCVVLPKS